MDLNFLTPAARRTVALAIGILGVLTGGAAGDTYAHKVAAQEAARAAAQVAQDLAAERQVHAVEWQEVLRRLDRIEKKIDGVRP